MKASIYILCMVIFMPNRSFAQSPETADHVIEGGKLIVELVKAFSSKKETDKDTGCKGKYADLCIENKSNLSISVFLEHRISAEKREVVILPQGKECSLQVKIGVWTYDLKYTGASQSLRKGDLLMEECNNLNMHINH